MHNSSLAASRRAAQCHARTVAAGPPRSARRMAPAAAVSALGTTVALPLFRPAALALAAVAVLLLAVHREDRRNAWRYVPEPVQPARLVPPPPAEQAPVVDLSVTAEPTTLVVEAVHVPTQVVPVPSIPTSRAAVEDPRGEAVHEPVPVTQPPGHQPRRRS